MRGFSSQGGSRLGFTARQDVSRRRIAVIASLDRTDAALFERAVQAGADALEVAVVTERDLRDLAEAMQKIAVPVGVVATSGAAQLVSGFAQESAVDWVRLPMDAPLSVLAREKPAHLLTVPVTLDVRLASAVSNFGVEAAVLEAPDASAAEITLGDALRLRALRDAMQKLVLLDVAVGIPPDAAPALDSLGINGLVVRVAGSGMDLIRDYIANLDAAARKPQE
jgi:hypothetical protein